MNWSRTYWMCVISTMYLTIGTIWCVIGIIEIIWCITCSCTCHILYNQSKIEMIWNNYYFWTCYLWKAMWGYPYWYVTITNIYLNWYYMVIKILFNMYYVFRIQPPTSWVALIILHTSSAPGSLHNFIWQYVYQHSFNIILTNDIIMQSCH